jgi:hypothetical protein
MADTDIDRPSRVIGNRAEGYSGPIDRADFIDLSNLYAAGDLHSTVEDLLRWNHALYSGEVVSLDALEAMRAGAFPFDNPDNPGSYGYGLEYTTVAEYPAIYHWGVLPGFNSCLFRLTDINLDFVLLSNMGGFDYDMCRVAKDLINVYFDEG